MFTDLPDDILLYLIQFLPYQSDLNALLRANGSLYALLNPLLYRHNVKHAKCSALQWAAKHGNVSTAQRMLDEGAPLDAGTTECWWLPIAVAVREGHDSIVSLLIERGVDLRAPTHSEGTYSCKYLFIHLFDLAVMHEQESMARILLPYMVDFESIRSRECCGCYPCCVYPVSRAARDGNLSLVKLLVDLGYDIETADENDDTPLIEAAVNGHDEVVSFLISRGANMEHQGSWGTALTGAAAEGQIAVVKTLIAAGARPDPVYRVSSKTLVAVSEAAEWGHRETARLLLDHIDTDQKIVEVGEDPHLLLRIAAICGMNDIIRKLLDSGDVIVNKLKERGDTDHNGAGWAEALEVTDSLETMKLLLEANPPHVRNRIGSALEFAIRHGAVEKTRLLLDYGADPSAKDYRGLNILPWALGSKEIFEMLLDYGASVDPAHETGEDNILARVIESGDIGLLEMLLKRGVKLQLPRRRRASLLKSGVRGGEKMMQFLLDHGMRIPAPGKMVDQCMETAARTGQPKVLQLFLDRGYNPDCDARRAKLLEVASNGDGGDLSATLDLLIRYGADLEARNRNGEPAVWCHARGGHTRAVQLLLEKGADPLSRNQSNECLLPIAAQSGNIGVVQSLLHAISHRSVPWAEVRDAWMQASAEAKDKDPKMARELDVFYCRTMFPV